MKGAAAAHLPSQIGKVFCCFFFDQTWLGRQREKRTSVLPTNNPQATSPQTLKNTQQNPCLMVGFFWNKALKPRLQITLGRRMQVHSGQVIRLPSSLCQAQGCGSPSQEEAGRGPSFLCLPAWGSPPIGGLWAQGVEGQPVWIHSQNVLSVSSQGCCSCGGRR